MREPKPLTQHLGSDPVLLGYHARSYLDVLERRRAHFEQMIAAWRHEVWGDDPEAGLSKQETPGTDIPRVSTDRSSALSEPGGRYGKSDR